MGLLLPGDMFRFMEKKRTNSGPFIESPVEGELLRETCSLIFTLPGLSRSARLMISLSTAMRAATEHLCKPAFKCQCKRQHLKPA
jgi:hypothetical protein